MFFNTLWVWFPLWVLWEAYRSVGGAFERPAEKEMMGSEKKWM